MSWLSGYLYRKSITLSRASGAVTNYQMKLLLGESSGATGEDVDCGALCQTDFDDIRFTTSDGTTLLDYWIESITGTTPNQLATIWIEFDSIGTDATTFYMYFGNAGATAYSNGANTFLKFDHFDNSSFDTGLWSKTEAKALTVTESGTALTVGGTINANGEFTDCYARSVFTYAQNYAVGARIKLTGSGTGYGAELRLQKDTSNNTFVGPRLWSVPTLNYLMEYKSSDDGTFYVLDETDLDSAYHRYEITYVRSTGVEKFYEDSVYKGTDTVAGLANVTTYIELSCIARVANDVTTAMFDWVYVRNFEATEPAWESWGPQETNTSPGVVIIPNSVLEMELLIRAALDEPSQDKITSAEILRSLNDGYKDVSAKAFCIENQDSATTVPGNRLVPYDGHRVNFIYSQVYTQQFIDGSAWAQKAPQLNSQIYINCLAEYNGKLYGGTSNSACLFEWNGTDAWIQVAPYLPSTGNSGTIFEIISYNGNLYGAARGYINYYYMMLFRWDVNIWTEVANTGAGYGSAIYPQSMIEWNGELYIATGGAWGNLTKWVGSTFVVVAHRPGGSGAYNVQKIVVYNNKIYGVTSANDSSQCGNLVEWAGSGDWVVKAGNPFGSGYPSFVSLVVFNNKLYAADSYWSGNLYEWDGVNAWILKASSATNYIAALSIYNNTLYGASVGGKLYQWNGTDAWIEKAATLNNEQIKSLRTYNNKLYAGTSVAGRLFEWNAYFLQLENDTSKAMLKVDPRILGFTTQSSSNSPKYWFQWGKCVVIEPVPDMAYPLLLFLSDWPSAELVNDSDIPTDLPDEFYPCITDFACYVLSIKLKKWKQSARYYNIYIRNLKKRRKEYMERKVEKRATSHRIPDNVIYEGGQPWAH